MRFVGIAYDIWPHCQNYWGDVRKKVLGGIADRLVKAYGPSPSPLIGQIIKLLGIEVETLDPRDLPHTQTIMRRVRRR